MGEKTVTIQSINARVNGGVEAFFQESDKAYEQKLLEVATDIRDHRKERPIILLSGPSGSGKTTSAQKIEAILDGWGVETHTLSMDNYFQTLDEDGKKAMREGKLDLESPERLDIPFLNEQLTSILEGKPTVIPTYDFPTNTRHDSDWVLTRKPGELVLLEGIHALNPAVITIPESQTVRIYVSVRTRIAQQGQPPFHPSGIRLMRRMLRDTLHRGRTVGDTLAMFPSVEAGAEKYIYPFKHRATHDIDTFFAYEPGAYRPLLEQSLLAYADDPMVKAQLTLFAETVPIPTEEVPAEALIREFIGPAKEWKRKK